MAVYQSDHLLLERRADNMAILWLDVAERSHNVFSRSVLGELRQALDHAARESGLTMLVIASRKESGFAAGADLQEFKEIKGAEEASTVAAVGQEVFGTLEALPMPTVAIVFGPCLGGGLECALACDYRIVLDMPGTQLGLPEIELGLIPGWGGTQRLPRVIGLENALRVILRRHRITPKEALDWGLADRIETSTESALAFLERESAAQVVIKGKRPKSGLPLRTWRQKLIESTGIGRTVMFRGVERLLRRRVPEDMPAPREALKAIRVGLDRGMEAGLAHEREAIARLAGTMACRNLMTLYFLIENAKKPKPNLPGAPSAEELRLIAEAMPIVRVGVVGAGTMGAGIAQLAGVKGFEVVVQEVNDTALNAGMQRIDLLFKKAVQRRVLTEAEARMRHRAIRGTTNWDGFGEVDLVVEAAIEDIEQKKRIFRELEAHAKANAILATNTSSILVQKLQEGLQHPQRVAALHFFHPVHKMPLVEVGRTPATEPMVIARLRNWAAALGKTPVVVGDSPGFVVNRILIPYLNEAGVLLQEGHDVDRLDAAMKRFGMPVGPFELLDQVGLDVAAYVARSVGPLFGTRLTPHSAIQSMTAHGWLGQKSGSGFYVYQGKKKVVHAEALDRLRAEFPPGTNPCSLDDAVDRMVLLMVNEAAMCLGERVAEHAHTIDLAMVMGTGWAPHRGGPLRHADDRGISQVLARLQDLARADGPRFEPCEELSRRVGTKESFYDALQFPR